jgi:hypothetical protein
MTPNMRPDILHVFDDHADDLKLKYVAGASHFVADDRPGAVPERALELFAQPWPEAGPGEGQPQRPQKPKSKRPHPPAGRPSLPAQLPPATSAFAKLPSATPDFLTGDKPSPKVTALAEKPARERAHCRLIEIEAEVAGLP